jgi:hypothetical protein
MPLNVTICKQFEIEKEGQHAPLFLFKNLALGLCAAIYSGGGFGIKFVTEASFICVCLLLFLKSSKLKACMVGAVVVLSLLEPALMQSPMLIATILLAHDQTKSALLVLLGSALQLIGGYNPFYLPLYLLPFAFAAASNFLILGCNISKALGILLVAINIAPTLFPQQPPKGHQDFAAAYQIDIAREYGATAGNTYTSIDDHGDHKSAKVMVLEHDPRHGLASHNWSQKRLWTENQYFGAPLLRIAAALDGFLYSNLGCRVDGLRLRLLGEAHASEHNHHISKRSGKLVFSDSDYLTNGAIGYQKNLTNALFSKFSLAHAIMLSTAICCCVSLFAEGRKIGLLFTVAVSLATCLTFHIQSVDIRVCDKGPPWPHSKGVGGIASALVDDYGIKSVARRGRAQVLGVARNSSATHQNEKVIVLEGGASVKVGNDTYEALDLPMGLSDGIIDAIPLRKKGENHLGKCIQKFGSVVLIGTNSARSNAKAIYESVK